MKKIFLNFSCWEGSLLQDTRSNFKHWPAFKYLIDYKQSNSNYFPLLRGDALYNDNLKWEYIKEVIATGCSQWEYQKFTFNFRKEIENDEEAMKELSILDDLAYYFTDCTYHINWYIEDEMEIEWKIWTNREEIDFSSYSSYDWILTEEMVESAIIESWFNRDEYEVIYDINKIEY